MPNDLTNPLQSIIAAAAKLPATTGATARHHQRQYMPGLLIIADVSGSMAERAGGRTKYDHLKSALDSVMGSTAGAHLLAFSSHAEECTADTLPPASGGTALHLALEAAPLYKAGHIIVISDGEPDDEARALAAAGKLPGIIDVIYCGADSNTKAMAFMRALARAGGGRVIVNDLVKSGKPLLPALKFALLPAPGKDSNP